MSQITDYSKNTKYIINDEPDFISESFNEILQNHKNKKICLISDNNIWQNCKYLFENHLTINNINLIIINNPICNDNFANYLSHKISSYDFVIALGSGTINDLCKYACYKNNLEFVIFSSAASMNGYLSNNCSIIINSHKKSINCKSAIKVYCDINIIKQAPITMIKAGIGDIMCFYSCYFDWYLAHKLFNYDFNVNAINLIKPRIDQFIANYSKYDLNNNELYKLICEILMISGIAMNMAESSAPVSQSEHILAHLLEMKYKDKINNLLHGQIIAITTIICLNIQNKILHNIKNNSFLINNVGSDDINLAKNYFGQDIFASCQQEYSLKISKVKNGKVLEFSNNDIYRDLLNIFTHNDKIKNIFNFFDIDYDISNLNINHDIVNQIIKNAKFIRNRLTCLDFI